MKRKNALAALLLISIAVSGLGLPGLAADEDMAPQPQQAEESDISVDAEELPGDNGEDEIPPIETEQIIDSEQPEAETIPADADVASEGENDQEQAEPVGQEEGPEEVPQLLEAVQSEDGVSISWSAMPSATEYAVYRAQRAQEEEPEWELLGTTPETTFLDETTDSGIEYGYTVAVVSEDGTVGTYDERGLWMLTKPDSPEIEAIKSKETHLTIEWEQVERAEGYCVYRDNERNQPELLAIVEDSDSCGYDDKEVVAGESYTYHVTAYISAGDKSAESDVGANQIKGTAQLPAPKNLQAVSVAYNKITLSWDAVDGAQGYVVYSKSKKTAQWKQVKTVTQTSYSATASCGVTTYYTVCAYVETESGRELGKRSDSGVSAKAVPAAPQFSKAVRSGVTAIKLTWNKDSKASGYGVYRQQAGDDTWKKIKTITKNSTVTYLDQSVKCGVTYSYQIRAFRTVNDTRVWGTKSKILSANTTPDAPELSSLTATGLNKASAQWSKAKGATHYQLQKKQLPNGSYSTVTNTKNLKYTISGLAAGTTYRYRVRAYVVVDGKKVYGAWSNTKRYTNYQYKYYLNKKMIPENIDLPGVKKIVYGSSGQKRSLYAYQVGNGKRRMVLNFSIHAWEDHWKADGYELTRVAVKLLKKLSDNRDTVEKEGWKIIVVPCANPDGYYNGYSHNGPGRCTTRRYNSSGKLVSGGVDLNRSFPTGFSARYNDRNYTGPSSLMTKEGRALRDLIRDNKGSRSNIYFDVHGWTQQILTNRTGSGTIYRTMHSYFPSNSAGNNGGGGYAAYYARSIGYDACLFEFPRSVTSHSRMVNNNYDTKFVNAIWSLVKNY